MKLSRRELLKLVGVGGLAAGLGRRGIAALREDTVEKNQGLPLRLEPEKLVGKVRAEEGKAPIPGATWYVAEETEAVLEHRFPAGALAEARYLSADLLVDGKSMVVFVLVLQEGEEGPKFGLVFSALNQCQVRMRVDLEAVDQNRWRYEREGAWLKPMCWGERVDLGKVDRMGLVVLRKAEGPARFCLTPVVATVEEPARLEDPVLPKGPLLDELGQSRLHEWPGKSRSAEEVTARLQGQLESAGRHGWPEGFSRWGGWEERKLEGTGFFRTHHDGKRWWLVDPGGHLFWSAGPDCVQVDTGAAYGGLEKALEWMPEAEGEFAPIYSAGHGGGREINYLAANLIRAFGREQWYERWAEIALGELKRLGFNTVGNWSEWEIARKAGFPYVRPLHYGFDKTKHVFRDFPDVFDPAFEGEARAFGELLRESAADPAMIGYFLMNEPTWGFAEESAAIGMLFNTTSCKTREALGGFLRERYRSEGVLEKAWGRGVTFAATAEGSWRRPLTEAAKADLEAFSTVMVEKLFGTLSKACREVDPNHLNLGARYAGPPPKWALEGMGSFDVFSVNCYEERVNEKFGEVGKTVGKPILVGEWHFGALDVGLPASGIGRVKDQEDRGRAYRVYLEDAAAKPWCVGAHWFTLYDQSALGRFDGENYNIGFLDVCHRPYEGIGRAARASHERLYEVAAGKAAPFAESPEYLEKLFL